MMPAIETRGVMSRSAVLIAALLLAVMPLELLAAPQVAIIYSDSTKHTLRTLAGLEQTLKESQKVSEIRQYFLSDSEASQRQAIESSRPDLLVTIGTSATQFADRAFPQLPIVFAKVLNPIESGFIQSWDLPGRHVTGAALDIPADLQLRKFVSMIPNMKKVGVIYTENTRRLVEEAKKAATQLGLQLVAYKIVSAKQLPEAIDSLCRSVEGIWTVADEELSTPQFVRYTLLETLRNRIPVMGFNQTFVESGALFCLEADYKYVGRQAGEIASANHRRRRSQQDQAKRSRYHLSLPESQVQQTLESGSAAGDGQRGKGDVLMDIKRLTASMGLKWRLILGVSVLLLASSILLSFFMIGQFSDSAMEALQRRGNSLVRNLAINAEFGVMLENSTELDGLVQGLLSDKDILFAEIYTKSGSLLTKCRARRC